MDPQALRDELEKLNHELRSAVLCLADLMRQCEEQVTRMNQAVTEYRHKRERAKQ